MIDRKCTRCGETKPSTREYFGSTPSGGLRGYCRSCMNKASAVYEANNKPARRARDEKRAAATGGVRRGFDLSIKLSLFSKQNGRCPCCFELIDRPENGEVDHMAPLAKNGRDDPSNYVLTHARCNREKHGKTMEEHWDWRVKKGLDRENLGRKHGLIR